MTRVLVVHGVSGTCSAAWREFLTNALARAGFNDSGAIEAECMAFSDIFRPAADPGPAVRAPWPVRPPDVSCLQPPGAWSQGPWRLPGLAQGVLRIIGRRSRFWSDLLALDLAGRVVSSDLAVIRRYFAESGNRTRSLDRVASRISSDTRVVIGHSFGSIVAYEALCAHPEWPVHTLVTVGSPLGISQLISCRLNPAPNPAADRLPGGVRRWVNLSDPEDLVALVPNLASRFGPQVEDYLVNNGRQRHDLNRYLGHPELGSAVAAALGWENSPATPPSARVTAVAA
jgi:pimeloyl-ACP methyl ester carboxylesterase